MKGNNHLPPDEGEEEKEDHHQQQSPSPPPIPLFTINSHRHHQEKHQAEVIVTTPFLDGGIIRPTSVITSVISSQQSSPPDDAVERQPSSELNDLMKKLEVFLDTPKPAAAAAAAPTLKQGPLSSADNERTKRPTKTIVHVRIVFVKIGDIDTPKEQYIADIYIQSRWREPLLDNKPPDELKATDLSKLWTPCLYIENSISESKDSSYQTAVLNENGEAFIAERRKVRGVFFENLELEHFPLDVQDLSITVASERPETDVELVPDDEVPSSVNVGTFGDKQEWKLYQHVDVTKKSVKIEFANHQRQHSAIQATCRAARRAGFFAYNVFFVMFLITCMALCSFAVDCNLPQNRLQLSFTLLLTSIAFKMAINQSLPKISYLTYLDKYIIMSILFLVVISIWHAIAGSICSNKAPGSFYAEKSENYVMAAFVVLFAAGNVTFGIFISMHGWKKRHEMAQKDRQFRVRSGFYSQTAAKPNNKRQEQA